MSQRFKPYSDYEESGVAWIGEMPSHWGLQRTKTFFNRMQRPVRPQDGIVTAFRDGEVTLRSNRRTEGFTNAAKEIGYQGVRVDDLIVDAMDGFAGAIGVSDSDGKCSPVYSVCTPKDRNKVQVAYYGYLVRQLAVTDFINSLAKGIRERSTEFRYSEFSILRLAVPPVDEQKQIASFLDYETAKIDALIEKQQQLIALLGEKRQAVISHAVTKGLNPDAPMRDSGVEWLGEVPEHWNLKQLRNVSRQLGGGTPSKDNASFWDGDIPWVSPKDMKVDYITTAQDKITEAAVRYSSAKLIPVGSVLIVVRGMILDHSVPTALTQKPLTVNQDMKAVLPGRDLNGEFLLFFFNGMRDYLLSHTYSSAHGTKVMSIEKLERTFIALPDLEEQSELVAELKERLARLDVLIAKSNGAMDLLQERRTALISAAVTGKIDVRGWKRSSAAPKEETEMEVA